MGKSLYHLLGVDRDAEQAAIGRAFRERVKDHHPDVSEDPNAAEAFKRLTTAREVLVDDQARARYDRLGHEAYVSAELDSEIWDGVGEGTVTPGTETPSRATTDTGHADGTGGRTRQRRAAGAVHSRVASDSTSAGSHRHGTSAGHRSRPTGVATERVTAYERFRATLVSLGPWLIVHAIFLVTAAGAAVAIAASTGSMPALSLPLGAGFFGLALFLSALHVVSVLYV